MLEKALQISLLNEFYGKLLTGRQQNILVDYYDNNMSLAEIAENLKISRQAVRDSLIKSKKALFGYEAKLGMLARYNDFKLKINSIANNNELTKEQLKLELKKILNLWEG